MHTIYHSTLTSTTNKLTDYQTNFEQQNNLDKGCILCCGSNFEDAA